MTINNMTAAESIFWTSNVIPLLMAGLFYLQHYIVPDIYQEKNLSFDAIPEFDNESPSATIANDKEDSLSDAISNSSESFLLIQPTETEETKPTTIYQDEHIRFTAISKFASELKWKPSNRPNSFTATQPDDQHIVSRFLVAGAVYWLQLYLLNQTSLIAAQLPKEYKIRKGFAFLLLLVPTTACALSMSRLMPEVNRAVKDERIQGRGGALAVMTLLKCWLFFMTVCLAMPWFRVLVAQRGLRC